MRRKNRGSTVLDRMRIWQTILVSSPLETNLGLLPLYFIHRAVNCRRREDLSRAAS